MNEPKGGGGKKNLAVYAIIERDGKSYWLRVGAAFPNRDGSVNLYLDAVPVMSNRLQVREQRDWDGARTAPAARAAAEAEAEARP